MITKPYIVQKYQAILYNYFDSSVVSEFEFKFIKKMELMRYYQDKYFETSRYAGFKSNKQAEKLGVIKRSHDIWYYAKFLREVICKELEVRRYINNQAEHAKKCSRAEKIINLARKRSREIIVKLKTVKYYNKKDLPIDKTRKNEIDSFKPDLNSLSKIINEEKKIYTTRKLYKNLIMNNINT
jgi:hypothetical protein